MTGWPWPETSLQEAAGSNSGKQQYLDDEVLIFVLMMYNISQNKELWEEMDKTGERHFVECAPRDRRSEDDVFEYV